MVTTHQPRGWEDDSHVVNRPVLDLPAAKATVERKHTEKPNQRNKQTNKQTDRQTQPNPTQPAQPTARYSEHTQAHDRTNTQPSNQTRNRNEQAERATGQTHARVSSDRKRNKRTNTGAKRNRIEPTTSMRRCGLVHAMMAWPHPPLSAAQKGKTTWTGGRALLDVAAVHGVASCSGARHVACCSGAWRCMLQWCTPRCMSCAFTSQALAAWPRGPILRPTAESGPKKKSIHPTCAAAHAFSARHETRWDAASCTPHVAMYTLGG